MLPRMLSGRALLALPHPQGVCAVDSTGNPRLAPTSGRKRVPTGTLYKPDAGQVTTWQSQRGHPSRLGGRDGCPFAFSSGEHRIRTCGRGKCAPSLAFEASAINRTLPALQVTPEGGRYPTVPPGLLPLLGSELLRQRIERDSNPRDACAPTRFPGVPLQPLGHLSFTS